MPVGSGEKEEAAIRRTLTLLQKSFREVRLGPPISEGEIQAIRDAWGDPHPGLTEFLRICDGITVGLEDEVEGALFSSADIVTLGGSRLKRELTANRTLVPIREDGTGNYDCVVSEPGVGSGSLVFWDHEATRNPAYLLGSTVASYISMWTDWLRVRYRPDGRSRWRFRSTSMGWAMFIALFGLDSPWPLKQRWLRKRDPGAAQLLDDPEFVRWLAPRGKEWNWRTFLRAIAGRE